MSLTQLKKTDFIPFIDTSGTINTSSWVPTWVRVSRSTICSLNPNPQTVTEDFISYDTPATIITGYQPELPLDLSTYEGDPAFDFIYEMFFDLPVGSEATVPLLFCFGGTDKRAWRNQSATLQLGELSTVDKKISFSSKLGGTIEKGTYSIADGVPTFGASSDVPVSAVAWSVTAPVKSATPQATFASGTGYTGAITWSDSPSTFAGSTVYTATVVLTAASGYKFDSGFSVYDVTGRPSSGFSVSRDSATQVTLTAVYAATAA